MILSPEDTIRCEEISGRGLGRVKPIVAAVAEATGIPTSEIMGDAAVGIVKEARQLVYYLARKAGVPTAVIARVMHRDPTTVTQGYISEKKRRGEA